MRKVVVRYDVVVAGNQMHQDFRHQLLLLVVAILTLFQYHNRELSKVMQTVAEHWKVCLEQHVESELCSWDWTGYSQQLE